VKYLRRYEESLNDKQNELNLILTDCKQYIEDVKESGIFLYRGVEKNIYSITKSENERNRQPVDTDINLHDYINDFFENKFGIRLREECVFTFQHDMYQSYGTNYLMFPIGEYTYYTSKDVLDLYRTLSVPKFSKFALSKRGILDSNQMETFHNEINEQEDKFIKLLGTYKEYNSLSEIGETPCEIMIDCDSYYLIPLRLTNDVKKMIINK